MLTDTKVRAAKPRPKPYKLTDANRLFLLVTPSGRKLWRWSYYFEGKQKGMAFGSYSPVSPRTPARNETRGMRNSAKGAIRAS